MSESLRNDGRVWVPKKKNDTRKAVDIPEDERDYYLERIYPAFGNLVPRDVASRRAKEVCDNGQGVGNTGVAVYLDFKKAIKEKGEQFIKEKYGNLFDMYQNITDENPYKTPMKIYPAVHYTMGGLWVDYNLMTTIPGLFSIGESNFSDHGANRLGASALMQGLADGYFVAPHTVMDYLAKEKADFSNKTDHKEFTDAVKETEKDIENIMSIKGDLVVDEVHRELGKIVWDKVGMARDKKGLNYAIESIPKIKEKFWNNVYIPGSDKDMNQELEKALRLNPEVFQFTSVGIGTSHNITAKKQNAKSLIAVDNMIQAPLSEITELTFPEPLEKDLTAALSFLHGSLVKSPASCH